VRTTSRFFKSQSKICSHRESDLGSVECYLDHLTKSVRGPFTTSQPCLPRHRSSCCRSTSPCISYWCLLAASPGLHRGNRGIRRCFPDIARAAVARPHLCISYWCLLAAFSGFHWGNRAIRGCFPTSLELLSLDLTLASTTGVS
jgi:hypothetical protein